MQASVNTIAQTAENQAAANTLFRVLAAISFCHLLNDLVQSLIPAIYPILKSSFHLDFGQIGLITLTYQMTASLLQPVIGLYTDHHPKPYSLAIGMGFTLFGLVFFSMAPTYVMLLAAAARCSLYHVPTRVRITIPIKAAIENHATLLWP